MTDIVERAKELRAGITRGPWKLKTMRREKYQPDVVHTPHGCLWHPSMGNINNRADGEFIAAAPELVDDLIAEVEHLRALQRDDQETAKQIAEVVAAHPLYFDEYADVDGSPYRCKCGWEPDEETLDSSLELIEAAHASHVADAFLTSPTSTSTADELGAK